MTSTHEFCRVSLADPSEDFDIRTKLTMTVVIPTFNRARYLPECLDSVLGQTRRPDQVIVVDDGSTDETAAVVARYGAQIEYLHKENGGKSTALNAALPLIRGEIFWIFDDDDIAIEDSLERHVAALEQHPGAGFTYGGYVWFEEVAGVPRRTGPEVRVPQCSRDELFVTLLRGLAIAQQGMTIRTRCLDRIGPFDTRYPRAQDYEFILRLARHFDGAPVEAPVFYRRLHEGTRGPDSDLHRAEDSFKRWFDFEQKLFRELRRVLAIHEYLPRSIGSGQLAPNQQRRALLQRACVMARRALWEDMLQDLSAAVVINVGSLTPDEHRICAATLSNPLALHRLEPHVFDDIARVCRASVGGEIQIDFGRGLLSSLRAEGASEFRGSFLALVRGAVGLMGPRGMAQLAARKFGFAR